MPTQPNCISICKDLESYIKKPDDPRRCRISNRLHQVGDTVLIVDLKTKGTILDFTKQFVTVLPHDYGVSVRRAHRNLRSARGINPFQRERLDLLNVYYNDHLLLHTGTHPAPGRVPIKTVRHKPY